MPLMPVKRDNAWRIKKLREDKKRMWDVIKKHPCKAYRQKIMKQYDDAISKLEGDK